MRLPVVLVLCACQPDPTDDDPLRTDTADPALLDPILHVVSPGDGWVDVAPLTDVVFTFDATLDAEIEPTVELADDRGRAVRTTARVAGDELRIEPSVALAWGRSHTVRVDGLVAEDGRLIDTVTSSFTVHPFPPVTRSLGERSLSISVYDDAGNTIRFVLYDDPGPDGEFGTPDDVQSYRNETLRDDDGNEISTRRYEDPGPDQRWQTADDVATWRSTDLVDAGGTSRLRYGVGPDGRLDTADDVVIYALRVEEDPASGLRRVITSFGVGADETLFTGDDPDLDHQLSELDPDLGVIRYVGFDDAGVDGVLYTSDDIVRYVERYEYEDGLLSRSTYYDGPGADTVWETSDDVVGSTTVGSYDDDGFEVGYARYDAPGPDATWFTADDVAGYRRQTERSPEGLVERVLDYSGPATEPGSLTVTENDARGFPVRRVTSYDPGPDGLWDTADDPADLVQDLLPARDPSAP